MTSDTSKYLLLFSLHLLSYLLNLVLISFLIGNDGVVYEGTGWGVRGAHTYGYNANGTGIAFIGNYQGELSSTFLGPAPSNFLFTVTRQTPLGCRADCLQKTVDLRHRRRRVNRGLRFNCWLAGDRDTKSRTNVVQ